MQTYVVVYDIVGQPKDYKKLHECIKAYGRWARPTESTWLVNTSESAEQIRDKLLKVIDENDRLFVVLSGVESAWKNVRCANSWLQKYL